MALSLKRYSGFRKIAEGGMSEIYRAVERSSGRKVVIKKVLLEHSNRAFIMNRCENEARSASEISHENIISILDYGEDRGWFCIVMEYIDGCNLESLMAEKTFNREIGMMIVLAALRALRAAHKKGIVHCDVKPSNILIDSNGRVVLSDFGLSQARSHTPNTVDRQVDFATPLYMPPEQAKLVAEHIGLASDVWAETASIVYTDMSPDENRALRERGIQWDLWSVGVLLYRICTGNYPFSGNDLAGLLTAIVHAEAKDARAVAADLPSGVASAIGRCLEKESYRRPHSLDPVIDAMQRYIATLDIGDSTIMIAGHMAGALPNILKSSAGFKDGGRSRKAGSVTPASDQGTWLRRSFQWLPALFSPRSRFSKPVYAVVALLILVIFGTLVIKERSAAKRLAEPAVVTAIASPEQKNDPPVALPPTPRPMRSRQVQETKMPAKKNPPAVAQVSKPARTVASNPAKAKTPVKSRPAEPAASSPKTGAKGKVQQPPPASDWGILRVTVDPAETRVFLDGAMITSKEMAAGKRVASGLHDCVAQAMGYEPYQRSVHMEAGKTQVLSIVLKQKGNGKLHVYSYPWSDLYIDGTYIGTTPTPTPIALIEGEHKLLLRREGYKSYKEVVVVKADEVTRLQVQMERSE
jgi:serine/threonine protein kinase